MMRIICAIVLIAFGAVSSIRAQDIEPQPIPRPSTKVAPATEGPPTTTEINGYIPDSTTENVEETPESTVETQTAPNPTMGFPTSITTTEESVETTTETIVTSTTEEKRTTISATTTNVPTIPIAPTERTPGDSVSRLFCATILQDGAPCFNWIYGVFIIPKACYYCCHSIGEEYALQNCIEINPFFCR